ncbi:hypothetical protein KUC74_09480 [Pseudomonas aeruginosa]|uniref:hypothetical protein n=1 Tax=Pseudomonas aeruginosa TaxID=287 RepID=UPI0021E1AB50|nr:hypothetical protein [Pseudomonas aeruginosa]MCV0071178.1 hypothetical protein [Pseudomonas aeruginosa]
MHTENMKLWNAVDKTDPSATKTANVNGQTMTSIIGQYMFMRATEQFGPYGIGWRCEVANEQYVTGAKIMAGEKGDIHIGDNIMHTMRIRLIYTLDGKEGVAEHVGCTPFVYKSKYGATTDMEAPKKTFTDSVKKCLSMLGFSADIFLGMFDDRNYVEVRREEEQIAKAEDQQAAEEQAKEERLAYIKSIIETMQGAQSQYELKKIHDVAVRKLTARKDDSGVKRIAREFSEQIKRFNEEKAA